jgi:hypothetical protein
MNPANLLNFAADGNNKWDPYFVAGVRNGLLLGTFEQPLAKKKEVPRISLQLDMDDLWRLAKHRAQAICY